MQQQPGGENHSRLQEQTLICAALYALADSRVTITVDDLDTGWKIVNYVAGCRLRLAGRIGQSELSVLLDRVEQVVRNRKHEGIAGAGYLKGNLSDPQRNKMDDHGGAKRLLDRLCDDGRLGRNGNGYVHVDYLE